jgi:uncharacterized membrane protein
MESLGRKDLGLIFLLALSYIIVSTLFPHLKVDKFLLSTIFLVLMFIFSGYALTAMLYPNAGCGKILKKPVLILELSVALTVAMALALKYFRVEINLGSLIILMAFLTMIFSVGAAIGRGRYIKSNSEKIYYRKSEIHKALINNENEVQHKKKERIYSLDEFKHEKTQELSEDSPVNVPESHYRFKDGLNKDLLIIDFLILLTALSFLIHALNKAIVVDVLGAFFIALIPGYLLMTVMFPKNDDIERVELLGMSFGLSLVITSIVGLILNYTVGMKLKFIIMSLMILSITLVLIAHIRRMKS